MRAGVAVLVAAVALVTLPPASGSPSSLRLYPRHTDRRVVAIAFFHDVYYAQLENGRLISGQPGSRDVFKGYCPKGWSTGYSADIVDTNIDTPWSICVGQPGAGQPELDFGEWADVVWGRLGFVLLERNGHSRLIETADAGRTWSVVHRWR